MAALNFPTTGLVAGVTEYSANGTTYLWDGVKWVGRTAGGAAGTNSIQNNGNTVQVDAGGNLALPAFAIPNTVGTTGQVLKWPSSGTTLAWANDDIGTYSDANVASYLVANPQSGTYSDANVASYLVANPQSGTYSDANVAAYLTGNITTGNVRAAQYNFANGVNILSTVTGGGPANTGNYNFSGNILQADNPIFRANDAALALAVDTTTWTFGSDGKLTLPTDGSIDTYSGTGGFKITTDGQIQFASGYSIGGSDTSLGLRMATDRGTILFGNHPEPGTTTHFHIMKQDPYHVDLFLGDDLNYVKLKGNENIPPSMPYGVEIGTNDSNGGSQNTWRFGTDGNLVLPQGSTISDKDESLDIVVDRPSQSSYWYNIFGYTGAVIDSNTAINGSVCHDTGGNVYALGSVYGTVSSDNLFMKFSPEGELLWRRTWTDKHGNPCGSYNSSMRFIAANVALGTQDTILWAAFVGWEDHTSYVGTMDTDGNMVDEFGNPRLATRLEGIKVTDVEWAGNVESFNSAVYAVGNYRAPGYNYIPCVYGVDLDTSSVIVDSTVSPAGVNLAFGSISNGPWTNTFNATVPIPTIPSGLASIGTYFDGDFNHAMVTFLEQGPPASIAIGTANHGEEDIYGEDICCDANGNVYVIVNNVSNNYAVVIKGNAFSLPTGSSIWQIVIGTPESPNQFYATSIAYYQNHVYVLGQYRNDATSNVDVVLVKINEYTGIVWQRVIGTPGTEGLVVYGAPGLESTSGIHVKDGLIAIAFATSDHSVTGLNTITLQYPIDGSVLGTFGDFYINEFDAGHSTMDYSIVELTVGYNSANTTTAVATLNPTVQTVGTGWTSIRWDLTYNRQVYGPQTFKFTDDGMFDTAEITHEGEVRITAAVAPDVIELTPSTWAFQNNDGLRFPDGSVQYGAYVEQETALDGGSAVSVYNIVPRPLVADGGGSSSRHGVTDPVYDGSSGNDYVLDGGGA